MIHQKKETRKTPTNFNVNKKWYDFRSSWPTENPGCNSAVGIPYNIYNLFHVILVVTSQHPRVGEKG